MHLNIGLLAKTLLIEGSIAGFASMHGLWTGETSWRQVADRMLGRDKETVHLIVREADGRADEKIVTSINHPFFVKEKGWVEAAKLSAGDLIATSKDGGVARAIQLIVKPKPMLSYNLSVNEDHTFFVFWNCSAIACFAASCHE
jgi:hypothetical protein